MKVQHYDRVEVTYIRDDQLEFARQIGFVESQRDGVRLEMDVKSNPRNIDGYRTALGKDIAALRAGGAVVKGIPTSEALDAIKRGKLKLPGFEHLQPAKAPETKAK